MKNKKAKKGFTLVELLVVITILAVLATVSVIGYRSFTKKAQVSNDTSLVAQLNIALKANEATDGKPETPTEMLEVMNENGFNVEKLTPTTSKYNIVWNQEANEFALFDENDDLVYGNAEKDSYKTWKFLDAYVEGTEYSVYLKGTSVTGELKNVKAGLDVGKNENISAVCYDNNDSSDTKAIIRTLSGEVTAYGAHSTVLHYGFADQVIVNDEVTFIENGIVGGLLRVNEAFVTVKKKANQDKSVSGIYIEWVQDYSNYEGIVGNRKVIVEDNSPVIFSSDFEDEDDILEQVKSLITAPNISSSLMDVTDVPKFRLGDGTKENPYILETNDSWSNMAMEASEKLYFKLGKDITPKFWQTTVAQYCDTEIDLNGHTVFLDSRGSINVEKILTIKDSVGSGKILASGTPDNYGVFKRFGNAGMGTVVLDGCIIESCDYILSDNMKLIVNDGTIRALEMKHDDRKNIEIILNGGLYNFDPSNYIDSEQFSVVKVNDYWCVTKNN